MMLLLSLLVAQISFAQITSNGTGGGDWNSTATWIGGVVPASGDNVVIQATDSVFLSALTACTNLTVNGKLNDSLSLTNTFTVSGTLTLASGATLYLSKTHGVPGGTIALAAASTVYYAGTQTAVTNTTYGNLIWGSTGTGLLSASTTINGNLNITTATFRGISATSGSFTHFVAGDVTIGPGASARISGANSTAATTASVVWNINGNVSLTGNASSNRLILFESAGPHSGTVAYNINGNITIGSSSQIQTRSSTTVNASPCAGAINVKGNILNSGTSAITSTTGATGTSLVVNMNGTSPQTYTGVFPNAFPAGQTCTLQISNSAGVTLAGAATVNANVTLAVANGARLTMGANVLSGAGNITVNAGATVESGHASGLNGNITNTGADTLSSGANYTFNGLSAQVTGTLLPSTVNNLTINNTAGVTLSKTDTVSGLLTLTNGLLKIGTKNLVTNAPIGVTTLAGERLKSGGKKIIPNEVIGGSISSYIVTDSSGTLTANGVGSTQTIFPVGTSAGYAPLWITNTGAVDTFTVATAVDTLGGTKNGGGRVNQKWSVAEKTLGSSTAAIQFGWIASSEDAVFAANRSGNVKIFQLSDTTQVGTGSYTSQFTTQPYTLSRGGISSFGTFAVGNFTGFVPGDGDYRSHQSGPWSDVNTWERNNGSTWIYPAPSAPTAADSVITIQNGHIVEVSDSVYADQITVSAGGTVKIDSAKTLALSNGTGTDLTVLGTITNAGTVNMSSGGTMTVGNGGTYEHAQNGGVIPSATWSTGSLFKVTGTIAATSFTSGGGQNFCNIEWNCPNQTANTSMGLNGATISGNFKIVSTNTGRVHFFGSSSSTVTINGDVIMQGGNFAVQGTSSISSDTVKHFGNISVTGGNFSISRGSQGGSGITVWYVNNGNVSLANATTQNSTTTTSGGFAKFVFAKAGSQTLTLSSVTYAGAGLPIEVSSGTTLSMGTSMLGGASTFTLNAGATLESGWVYGLDSTLATTGTKTLSKAANYTFNGLSPQVTGTLLPDTVNNLTIKDTLGVRLSAGVTVNGALTLTTGRFLLGSKNLAAASITGGSAASYVATDSGGTLKRYAVGSTQTLFPVGTKLAYSPVWITNAGTIDTFTVAVAPDSLGGIRNGNGRVKLKWNINEKTAGGSNATLQFGWYGSQEDSNFTANRAGNALIVHLPDTVHVGTGAYTSQFTTLPYTLSRGGITAFGFFAVGRLGSITAVGNTASVTPNEFSLAQNYPNPFNPSTVIYYQLPKESRVSLKVYSMLGQEVATLVDESKQAGSYTVTFSAQNGFASGVYFYRIQAGDFVAVKKMMLMK